MNIRLSAVAAAALVTVAGCGLPGSHPAVNTAATPQACRQQYETWKHGPAAAGLTAFTAALQAVQQKRAVKDMPGVGLALRRSGKAAAALAAVPPPRCADPRGYYARMFAWARSAALLARPGPGTWGVRAALVPLKGVQRVGRELGRELDRTVGPGR